MDAFQDNAWDLFDYPIIEDASPTDFYWTNQSTCMEFDVSPVEVTLIEKDCKRKREENESCSRAESKACREKIRRDRINHRFLELSSILEPGKPAKNDKIALLDDTMRAIYQLRTEARQLQEKIKILQNDLKILKEDKNELREETQSLKLDKEKMDQKMKAMTSPSTRFAPTQQPIYNAAENGTKLVMTLPSYGSYSMWQWIPQAVLDTSQDHVLRPPVA